MNTLFLHQPVLGRDCRAWLAGEGGLTELGLGTPEHFASLHPGSRCVFFLPSSLCLFTSAAVSSKQLKQAEQALAWLIEEQTGEDVENLHVIAGPQAGEETPLIAISRPLVEDSLQRLRSAGLLVAAVLPDLFLLPQDESDWQLAQRDYRLMLRTGFMRGAVLEPDVLELMLDGALLERTQKTPLTVSVAVPEVELGAKVDAWAARHEGVSCRLAEHLDATTALSSVTDWARHPANLLQGSFASRNRFRLPAGLRYAAMFIAAAFALQLLSEWMHFGYYRYQSGRAAQLVVNRYKSLYPQERLPAATSSAMNEIQKRMRGRRNENRSDASVLPTLTRVAELMQGTGLNAQRVDFLNGTLTLDVDARSLADLDGFKQKLDAQGFSTEIVSANNQGGMVRGRLRVEGGV